LEYNIGYSYAFSINLIIKIMNKNTTLYIVLIIVVVGLGVYFLNKPSAYNPVTQGKVVLGVTDASADMTGVSSVVITVNKVAIHSTSSGWVTISSGVKEYDLLTLKKSGVVSLLAQTNVTAGTYDQIRLNISKVVVVRNNVQTEAKLPSSELKIIGKIVVNADKTSTAVFDFMADKSLHATGDGKFIFAPVIRIEKTSDANVEVKMNDELSITGGNRENDEDVGMDEKGEVREDFELKGNLEIDVNDDIQIASSSVRSGTKTELHF
jgi:hypothetical protein